MPREFVPALGADEDLPAGASPIYLIDQESSQELGDHSETAAGLPIGRVLVSTVLGVPGGTPLKGPISVAGVLSHEALEMTGDRYINLWASAPDGYDYAVEWSDPIENDSYSINGVMVSNFTLPDWFNQSPAAGAKFDYLGKLQRPFSMTPGGYVIYKQTGSEHQKFARSARAGEEELSPGVFMLRGTEYPEWRKAMKQGKLSRTRRRAA